MFRFQLVALSGKKFDEDVYEVTLPTLEGEIGVLQHHMPLVSVATYGAITVRHNAKDRDDQREFFATNGGVIEVVDNTLRVLVDEADHTDDLNEAEVQAALESLVDRHSVRLQVAGLKRRRPRR